MFCNYIFDTEQHNKYPLINDLVNVSCEEICNVLEMER